MLRKVSKETQKDIYAIFNDGAIILNRENMKLETFGNVLKIEGEKYESNK